MNLAKLVASETGISIDDLMLLRHSNESTKFLKKCGATIKEYTAIQPVDSKYNFWPENGPRVNAVVVIKDDMVYAVYRVLGIKKTGSNYELGSPEYVKFDQLRDKKPRQCHYFLLEEIPTSTSGKKVYGWEMRSRTPVQRAAGSFFNEIHINDELKTISSDSFRGEFEAEVLAAKQASAADRASALQVPLAPPDRVAVISFEYRRNPFVVDEVLRRANGKCQKCGQKAPFERRSDDSPYLEVHHMKPLAQGGLDSVANAIALCPNCHRKAHYGKD